MKDRIQIDIPQSPVGKSQTVARGRITNKEKTRVFINFVRTFAKMTAPKEPWNGAVAIDILYTLKIPSYWSKKKRAMAEQGDLYATVYPDGDNVSKSVCDALSKVIYHDDRQIVDYRIRKKFGTNGHTRIIISNLENIPPKIGLE